MTQQQLGPASATVPVAEPGAEPRSRSARLRAAAPLLTALGLFAAVRLTGVVAMTVAASLTGKRSGTLLGRSWDSLWYLRIAANGYGRSVHYKPGIIFNDLAFFPLYPGLVRAVGTVLPLSGGATGMLIAWTASLAAAAGIYLIGVRLHSRPVAVFMVLLWGCCRTP